MRIRTILTAAAAPAALAAVLLGAVGPAGAATTSGPAPGHFITHERYAGQLRQVPASVIPHPHLPGHLVRHGAALSSTNWSGYALQACGTCHLRYVESDFTLPSINPTGAAGTSDVFWASHWVGLDDFGQVNYSGSRVTSYNGTRGGLGSSSLWTSYPITMQTSSTTPVMASPGGLYGGSNGGIPVSAFSDYWHADS